MAYSQTVQNIADKYKTDCSSGLSRREAKKRIAYRGLNKLKESKSKGILLLFFEQFNDFLIIILIAAACISFFTNILEGSGDIAEPVVIMTIVVFNAILGVVQERRAEKSLEALKKMSAPSASVIRDGTEISVNSEEVCTGDIIVLRSGDVVAADIRLFKAINLEVDESSLTGESVPIHKDICEALDEFTPLAERYNMAYSGTFVTGGTGKGIVVATGMDTEVGRIATLLSCEEAVMSPLQKKLDKVGKILGICALCICAFVFVIGVFNKIHPFDMFVTSISLAVAAIPEGLPAIVTIMLSVGVRKMAESGAIVRNLTAVEALGGADVICSDKTGTLTLNKMTVQKVFGDEKSCFEYGVICSGENTKNPTELAIIKYALDKKIKIRDAVPDEIVPFSSKTKQMRVRCGKLLAVKGAPEIILRMCSYIQIGNKTEKLSEVKKNSIISENKKMASEALRVIAVAYKADAESINAGQLVFCGLIGMSDPPRPEAAEAVGQCRMAGIKTVMITGDHAVTACAVAEKLGIISGRSECITGRELDCLSDDELAEKTEHCSVFARTTPEHKVRLVKAFRKKGKIVAMTGDGVNDAPALKCADIGCSLGKSGTDVAKASSDIVLTDDNFATIVKSVRMGREIYENIKKSVKFLLSSNIGEIITVFFGILLGFPTPLLAMQLLWINLVTDSLPAIALGIDPCDEDMLSRSKNTDKLFDTGMIVSVVYEGIMIGLLGLIAFCIGFYSYGNLTVGRTMAFCVLSISQLIHAFNMRSEKSIIGRAFFRNKMLLFSFLTGVILQIAVVCLLPDLFSVTRLDAEKWGIVALLSIVPLMVVEIQKYINRRRK